MDEYDQAMSVTTQADADALFQQLLERHMAEHGTTQTVAEKQLRNNLGYWAGYYDGETRTRVERLFKCAHPYFGRITEVGPPTASETFQLGRAIGQKMMERAEKLAGRASMLLLKAFT